MPYLSAELLDLSEDEIIEGLIAANGYTAGSLDTPNADSDDAPTGAGNARAYADMLGDIDPAEPTENLHTLAPLLAQLDDRERHILQMRFGQEMTQSEIGNELNVSQMHVSRLLNRTLGKLRAGMLTEH